MCCIFENDDEGHVLFPTVPREKASRAESAFVQEKKGTAFGVLP